ncbi:MAG: dipeptidase PepE [Thermoanaerobaculia bacterium]
MSRRLLLISTSTTFGTGYLDHAADEITGFLRGVRRVLFVPYALHDLNAYAQKARERFARMGFELDSIHEASVPREAVADADAVFIGGGNTFRLLDRLYRFDVLDAIRARVDDGMPYVGTSAGSNVACLSLKTTNDMPIVQPPSFEAFGFVPFNINPHFIDADPNSTHMGETRETRIREFHEMNSSPVVGLREGSWLRVEGPKIVVGGSRGARIFRRGEEPVEVKTGDEIQGLVGDAKFEV